ncbi:MAG: cell division protein FtsW [Lentisphaeria bacterium]|nr:cell division protein FtsW [Lentisphaeria bacterium]
MKLHKERIRGEDLLPKKKAYDTVLPAAAVFISVMVLLLLFGITMLYSTSFGTDGTTYLYKQFQWAVVGLLGFSGAIYFGYKRISDWSIWLMLVIAVLLLIADMSPAVKGAHRWIKIPKIGNIQPSEYAKLIIALFLAKFLSERARFMDSFPFRKVMWPCLFCCAVPIGLVLAGKDLGTTVLLTLIVVSALYIVGINFKWFALAGAILVPAGFFYIKYFDSMRWGRMTIFMDPEAHAAGSGYQLYNSLLALGSGNWFGIGFTESRMKMSYLPEAHTDFILSIVGEELGYFFLILVMVGYLAYMYSAIAIAQNARTRQGMILAFCIGIFIGAQALINMGVICGAFPTKGMPAPFISYGGSSLVTCLTASGFVLSVALDTVFPDYTDRIHAWHRLKWKKFKELFRWKSSS